MLRERERQRQQPRQAWQQQPPGRTWVVHAQLHIRLHRFAHMVASNVPALGQAQHLRVRGGSANGMNAGERQSRRAQATSPSRAGRRRSCGQRSSSQGMACWTQQNKLHVPPCPHITARAASKQDGAGMQLHSAAYPPASVSPAAPCSALPSPPAPGTGPLRQAGVEPWRMARLGVQRGMARSGCRGTEQAGEAVKSVHRHCWRMGGFCATPVHKAAAARGALPSCKQHTARLSLPT